MKKLEDFSKSEQIQLNLGSIVLALKEVLINTPELKTKFEQAYQDNLNQMLSEVQNLKSVE